MDPISKSDRLMAILRQRLSQQARTGSPAGRAPADKPVAGLDALSSLEGADEKQVRRACIQALLADQLGSSLLNDAKFQQVVTRVTDLITADPATSKLLDRVVADLRAG